MVYSNMCLLRVLSFTQAIFNKFYNPRIGYEGIGSCIASDAGGITENQTIAHHLVVLTAVSIVKHHFPLT